MSKNNLVFDKNNLVFDKNNFSGGFELKVKPNNTIPLSYIILAYPNNTRVHISGDPEIIKQIVERLDHQTIEYVIEHEANL